MPALEIPTYVWKKLMYLQYIPPVSILISNKNQLFTFFDIVYKYLLVSACGCQSEVTSIGISFLNQRDFEAQSLYITITVQYKTLLIACGKKAMAKLSLCKP
jgi:hypothetical protein